MFIRTVKYLTNFLIISLISSCYTSTKVMTDPKIVPPNFVHTLGTDIIGVDGAPLYLKGVGLGNYVWSNNATAYINDHSEIDFERIHQMGMNTVRFYLNYRFFESDNRPYQYLQSGWDWLDKNIKWAKKHQIYIVLNMHVPQGGFQSQGNGDALWLNLENQNRLKALWKAIALHYANEPQIIGFALVNEPIPTESVAQWAQLAQQIIDAIRQVDQHHIIFVEKALYVKGNYLENENFNFPIVSDSNLVYEFHSYEPFLYTHQLLDFVNLGDGGSYPDTNIVQLTGLANWYTATINNPIIPTGNSGWHYYEGVKYHITDSNISIAYPALVGARTQGSIYFDDIDIKEYDENMQFVRTVISMNLNSLTNWHFWSVNGQGLYELSNQSGHTDLSSLKISAATDDCNLSNQSAMFIPKQHYYYQINGWMKGDNIGQNAYGQLRLDFNYSNSPVMVRDKFYLNYILSEVNQWAIEKQVPIYLGEFGVGLPCFYNNKGGLTFVEDMVTLSMNKNIHFNYHIYNGGYFGIYTLDGTQQIPTYINQPLVDLFKNLLK